MAVAAAADRGDPAHPAPAWCTIHHCPRGQASVCPSPWAPSCVLQSCSVPGDESTHRPARRASRRRAAPLAGEWRLPHPSQAPSRPGSRRSGPEAGNAEMLEFALSQETARTAPLLPPVVGQEENLLFHFVSVPPLVQGPAVPTFSKKEQFPFPPGSQVHGTTVCDALPPHSRPRRILPVAKRVRFGDDIPPHAPLASPVWDPGSSVRMPQNAPPSVPSTPTPFRCTTTGTSIVPLEPLAQRLEAWLTLPSMSRWLMRTIRLGYAIQFARRTPKFNGVLETSVAVRNTPVLPLREVGVKILNYLDDWLILAQSREQLSDHRHLVLRHLSQLGLRVNWEKSKLSLVQIISFLGVELDSVSMTARLTEECTQAVLNCLSSFRERNVVPLKQFQRFLGHMASAAAVTLFGLLHMRPLQHWLHSRGGHGAVVHCE